MVGNVERALEPGRQRRSSANERRPSAANALMRLQQAAGNRAVGRVLARAPAKQITVRKGSKLSAADFVTALKRNAKAPAWLTRALSAKDDAILLSGDLKPPSDKIWLFDESFAKAFAAGSWEITTGKATIEVTDKGWKQIVVPDLSGARIGTWMKTGPDEVEFSPEPLFSQSPEAIYGWTVPRTAIKLRQGQARPDRDRHRDRGRRAPTGRPRRSRPAPTRSPRRSSTRSASTPAGSRRASPTCTTAAR